jgi:hypothetical protein
MGTTHKATADEVSAVSQHFMYFNLASWEQAEWQCLGFTASHYFAGKLHICYFHLYTGAFKTSRVESLYAELGEPELTTCWQILLCNYAPKLSAVCRSMKLLLPHIFLLFLFIIVTWTKSFVHSCNFCFCIDLYRKYLRDSEREQLCRQALTLALQALRAKLREGPITSGLIVEMYRAYQRVQRHLPHKESVFASLLSEAYKQHAKVCSVKDHLYLIVFSSLLQVT